MTLCLFMSLDELQNMQKLEAGLLVSHYAWHVQETRVAVENTKQALIASMKT